MAPSLLGLASYWKSIPSFLYLVLLVDYLKVSLTDSCFRKVLQRHFESRLNPIFLLFVFESDELFFFCGYQPYLKPLFGLNQNGWTPSPSLQIWRATQSALDLYLTKSKISPFWHILSPFSWLGWSSQPDNESFPELRIMKRSVGGLDKRSVFEFCFLRHSPDSENKDNHIFAGWPVLSVHYASKYIIRTVDS